MTVSSPDQDKVAEAQNGKSRWVKPAVRKMAAGSAEDGFGNLPDGGQPS